MAAVRVLCSKSAMGCPRHASCGSPSSSVPWDMATTYRVWSPLQITRVTVRLSKAFVACPARVSSAKICRSSSAKHKPELAFTVTVLLVTGVKTSQSCARTVGTCTPAP